MQSNCIPKSYTEHCQKRKHHPFEENGLTKSVTQKIAALIPDEGTANRMGAIQ